MVDEAAVGSLCCRSGENRTVFGALADSNKNVRAGNGDGLVLVINRRKLAACVAHGNTAHKLDAGDLAALAEDGLGCPGVVDNNTVGEACVLLIGNGGHLFVLLKAVHVDAALGQTACCTGNVDSRVAAADNDDVAAELLGLAVVDRAQEVKSAQNTLQLFAGDVQLCRLLQADRNVECLEAFLTQLLDGDILADLNAAAELNAHLAQNVDLGLYDVLADTEGGDAVYEHAAGNCFLLEHYGAVALNSEEVSAAHAGRACADDGDLLVKLLVSARDHGRNIAMLGLHILLCDEFLYLVDLQRLIDGAAGACILAVLAADAAADCREGVILLDELERIGVAAVGCHLDVALDRDVSRACDLAGCGAGGPGLDRAVFVFVVLVPVILAPLGLVGKLVMRILDGAFLGAELLAEADGAGRAGLNTLAAGDALLGVGLCGVCGSGKVGGIEKL